MRPLSAEEKAASRERRREYQKNWHQANKEAQNQRCLEWARNNPEKHAERNRKWAKENPDKISERRARQYQRRRADPAFLVRTTVSRAMRHSLRGMKSGGWEAILGYTRQDLVSHLERQFLRGMTWDNYGAWHIDHIVPLSSFSFHGLDDPEIRRAWALTNLRPLWGAENIAKGGKPLYLL